MSLRLYIDTLPEEEVPRTTLPRLLAGVAIAVVGLLVINALLARELEQHPRNLGYVVVESKWDAVEAMEVAPDWLFVGDSSCNQGIRASRVAEALGATAYNACTIGSATVGDDVWMVADLVRRGLVPEHVVIAHSWYTWGRSPGTLKAMLFLVEPGARVWRDTEPRLDLTLGDRWLARWGGAFPIASQAISAQTIVFDPFREGLPPRLTPGDDGYMAVPYRDDARLEADIEAHRIEMRAPFTISPWSQRAMDELLDLSDEHGFDVHFVVAPMPERLRDTPEAARYLAEHHGALEAIAARSPRVRVALSEPPVLPFEVFEKADHVTAEGANAYTDAVIDALR